MRSKLSKYIDVVTYAIICFPMFIHIKMVYKYAVNIPMYDDYDGTLNVFNNFKKASLAQRATFLFEQQCEHRALFSKLIMLTHYWLFGDINFRHLAIFDTIMLLVLFGVLIYFFRRFLPDFWQVPAIMLSFGVFDLNNFENAVFVGAGIFNYGVLMVFLLCLFLYTLKSPRYIIPAGILQVLLIYSGGNGMIGAFFILLYTIFSGERNKYITSLTLFLLFTPLYFYHYNFSNPNSIYFTLEPVKFLPYFIIALGANFNLGYDWLAGALLLIAFINLVPIYKKADITQQALPFLCIAGFIVTSLAVMSVFRGNLPIINAHSNRYLIYSHILMVTIFVFLFFKTRNVLVYLASVLFAINIYNSNYGGGKTGFIATHDALLNTDYCYPDGGKQHAKEVADESCRLGIYCIDKHRTGK